VDEGEVVQYFLDLGTRRLGRMARRVAYAANWDGRSETLVALPSMREANHTLRNPASGQEMSFVASIVDLRVLVILQMMRCSRLRGAGRIGK
jgi:hypothetical protein